jgi:ribosomal protein L40E
VGDAYRVAAGVCPHCGGPNPIGARICQWCKSGLTVPKSEDFPTGPATIDDGIFDPEAIRQDELIDEAAEHDQRILRYVVGGVLLALLIAAAVILAVG